MSYSPRSQAGLQRRIPVFAALLLSTLMPNPVQAQARSIAAHVPFPFQSGRQEMPAGDYRITYRSPYMILVESRDLKHSTYNMVQPELRGRSAMPGKLVFYRVAGRRYLKEVWVPEQAQGSKLIKTEMETKLLADSLFSQSHDAQIALLEVPVR